MNVFKDLKDFVGILFETLRDLLAIAFDFEFLSLSTKDLNLLGKIVFFPIFVIFQILLACVILFFCAVIVAMFLLLPVLFPLLFIINTIFFIGVRLFVKKEKRHFWGF